MRKGFSTLIFSTALSVAAFSQLQSHCDKQAPKISFSGKAPWAIDGKIKDWMTILGPYTGNNDMPFLPQQTSAFNWVNDLYLFGPDGENPRPESDMRLLAFTHDDYNVYFYLRRRLNGSSPNTFYYFLDVNGDAVMNLGEPVIHANFTDKVISPLTLGLYVPRTDSLYSQSKKGNFGFPFVGDVVDVFNSQFAFFPITLKRNEIFKAALTEDGYGIELAMPWRYLRNWLTLKNSLEPGDIFFYEVAMQMGRGGYNSAKVVDNAGSCRGGLAISGNGNVSKSITTTTLVPGSLYRFNLTYTNLTNAATEVGLEQIDLPLLPDDVAITVYPDYNCNGIVDANEKGLIYQGSMFDPFHFYVYLGNGVSVVLPPSFGKGCFIVDLQLLKNLSVTKLKISFNTSILFVEGREPCEPGCGSKPINHVGFQETEIDLSRASTDGLKNDLQEKTVVNSDVVIYPNPSRGNASLALPESADITVVDYLGRSIQTIKNAQPGVLRLKELKGGLYIVKVRFVESGRLVTKKLLIQP